MITGFLWAVCALLALLLWKVDRDSRDSDEQIWIDVSLGAAALDRVEKRLAAVEAKLKQ